MKRFICLLVGLGIIMSGFNIVFASENDKELESAILSTKEILQISDDEYVIDRFRKNNDSYILSWNSKDDDSSKVINATVKNNEIVSFYKSTEGDFSHISIANMSLDVAKAIADEFAKKASPSAFALCKYYDYMYYKYDGGVYNIIYQRYQNDIPVQNHMINVSVSAKEQAVTSFDASFDTALEFEDVSGIISFEDAKQSFINNFGYELKYIKKNVDDDTLAYLAYVPKSDFNNKYIDAKTGEIFEVTYPSYNYKYDSTNQASGALRDEAVAPEKESATLSKEEELLSSEVANLPSKDEIIKIIKDFAEFDIDDDYIINNYSIYRISDNTYCANIEFLKNVKNNDINEYFYKNVRYDITNNKIIRFYSNEANKYTEKDKQLEDDKCKGIAQDFVNKYYADEKELVIYNENRKYNHYFERLYDGIGVQNEGITIDVSKYTGNIISVNYQWENITFDSKDNIKSLDEFYNTCITQENLKPIYITYNTYDENGNRLEKQATKLIYLLDDYYSNYSAVTLKKIDGLGEEHKEEDYNYTDIENHYVKPYAQKLAEIGIGLSGEKLNPDENILKEDYLMLIAMANNNWYEPLRENLAKRFIQNGIIEKDDENLDEPVKRIDALRFMINNLGYKEIAQKNEIYNCQYVDVTPKMKGYASLGAALNIVSDKTDVLNADKFLTRADALIIIYNFLSRE